jgi:hypothetical protein
MSGLGVPCAAETAETKRARRCVMQLERDLPCKDEALTDAAAALLELSSASFDEGADCQTLARELERARMGGARLAEVCTPTGLDARTVQRRRAGDGLTRGDRRPGAVRPASSHALTEAERTRNRRDGFADTPPARIVPALVDEGVYGGSQSSFQMAMMASTGPSPKVSAMAHSTPVGGPGHRDCGNREGPSEKR